MNQFYVTRTLMDAAVTAHVLCLPGGVQITLWGGTLPHIGAVSTVSSAGEVSTVQFAGHKDGVVSERWARHLNEEGIRPVVVSAGIHYDNLSQAGIAAVVDTTQEMFTEILEEIRNAQSALV